MCMFSYCGVFSCCNDFVCGYFEYVWFVFVYLQFN